MRKRVPIVLNNDLTFTIATMGVSIDNTRDNRLTLRINYLCTSRHFNLIRCPNGFNAVVRDDDCS